MVERQVELHLFSSSVQNLLKSVGGNIDLMSLEELSALEVDLRRLTV